MGRTAKTTPTTKLTESAAPDSLPTAPSTSPKRPRCLEIAAGGVRTSGDFNRMMATMMADLVEGNITPQVANAVTNTGGKLLKCVEMQMKYGTTLPDGSQKSLELAGGDPK